MSIDPKDLPKMDKPLILGFKIKEDKFSIFQFLNWKVRMRYAVEKIEDKMVCSCAAFRFASKCTHVDMTGEFSYVVSRKGKWREEEGNFSDYLPLNFVALYDSAEEKLGRVDTCIGGLDLFILLKVLLDEGVSGVGDRDVPRLYDQCVEFSETENPVYNMDGVSVKCKVEPELDEEFDDTLVSPFDKEAEEKPEEVEKEEKKEIPNWKKVLRPDPKSFYVDKDVWEELMYSINYGENVLLIGPSGVGKSELTYLAAKAMGRNLEAFNMGASSEPRSMLIGNTHFDKEKGTFFSESRFIRAVRKEKGAVLLDEITRAERGAFNILLPLLDRQGYLALDESEDAGVIYKAEDMCFLATANIGMQYTGTDQMDRALWRRFGGTIDVDFPPEGHEVKLLVNRCKGLDEKSAIKLVAIALKQREMTADGDFIDPINTGMLLKTGERIANGMSFNLSCRFAILNQFSNEGGDASDRTKILQIIQKMG